MTFNNQNTKVLLCILDGFAIGDQSSYGNPVKLDSLPNIKRCLSNNQKTFLAASEEAVGLHKGQMGNSEVGHMIIGSGVVPMQDLPMINLAIKSKEIEKNQKIIDAIQLAKQNKSKVHIVGMYSSGGVHSHKNHIEEIAKIFASNEIKTNLHIITDGRDVSFDDFKKQEYKKLNEFIKDKKNINIATICGRFYAMDRDNRFEDRTNLYIKTLLKLNKDITFDSIEDAAKVEESDEFIPPIMHKNYDGIKQNDIVLFANFRSDRMRQIVEIFTNSNKLENEIPNVKVICMMEYFEDLRKKADILFEKASPVTCLSEIVSKNGKKQLKIAETEKYPHVTFFFNGNREKPFDGEDRILIPSPRDVKTYDEKPQMSLDLLQEKLFHEIEKQKYDLIVTNIANCDMVGHCGNFEASKLTLKYIDEFIGKLVNIATTKNYALIITADHGNIEETNTKHSLSKVPFIVINTKEKFCFPKNPSLANITPTILDLMSLKKHQDMHNSFCSLG